MQTTDTDTPRTEAHSARFVHDEVDTYELARQLERELNQAKSDIAELNQRLIERREAYEEYCAKITKTNHLLPELVAKVLQWGIDKGITGPNGRGTIAAQANKLTEEAAEVFDEVDLICCGETSHAEDLKLEIGDVFVSAILLCDMLKLTPEQCLQAAYEKISKRDGQMVGGTFVRNADGLGRRTLDADSK